MYFNPRLTVNILILSFSALSISAEPPKDVALTGDFASETALKASLARDCYTLKDEQLSPLPVDAFANTRLFVVYYSHLFCGVCVPVTERLKTWKAPEGVSLLLGYRDDADNTALTQYLKKSGITFPALDTKYIRIRRTHQGLMHPFYRDADEGAPRFRFFHADGTEIDPTKHGATSKFGGEIIDQIDVILQDILK